MPHKLTAFAASALSLALSAIVLAAEPPAHAALSRADFNRRAAELFLPLFWRSDANGNGNLEPAELVVLVGFPNSERSFWVERAGGFTASFDTAYRQMQQKTGEPQDPAERERHRLEGARRRLVGRHAG